MGPVNLPVVQGLDHKNRSVRFWTRPRTWPAATWRAQPGPVPVNPRDLPGLARPVGSNLWFCVSGFTKYSRIQKCYCWSQNIDIGMLPSVLDVLAA